MWLVRKTVPVAATGIPGIRVENLRIRYARITDPRITASCPATRLTLFRKTRV